MVCAVLVPAGQDRARQARPGARARRPAAAGRGQLRRLPAPWPASCPSTTRSRWSTSVNPARIEGQKTAAFEIVDALGDAPDIHVPAGRQRRQHHRLLEGLRRVRRRRHRARDARGCGASRRPAPRRSSTARRSRKPSTIATAIRIGNPASWEQAVAARDESGGLIDAVTDRDDPRGLPAARDPGGRLRRAGVGRLRRRAAAGARRRPARPGPDASCAPSPATASRTPTGPSPARRRR